MGYSEKFVSKALLRPSPSLLYNNLCQHAGSLLYAHVRQACTVPGVTGSVPCAVRKVESQHTDVIHSVRACSHNDLTFVIVTTESGIQVWDKSATHLLFVWSFPEQSEATTSAQTTFARGVAINVTADGLLNICFGASTGTLNVVEIGENGKFKAPVTFSHHSTPITCVGSAYQSRRGKWTEDLGCELVTCDEAGQIVVWNGHSTAAYAVASTVGSSSSPVVSVAVRSGFIVAGRLDGTVQIFGLRDGKLRSEIASHSRFMSALDIHPTKDVIATVAEDCTLNVWQLPIGGAKAELLLSVCWLHALLTGVAFCGPTSDDVAVVAYDTDEIQVYKYT